MRLSVPALLSGASPRLPAIRAKNGQNNLDAAGGRMKEIIEKEAVRRTELFQQAIELMAPITQIVKAAKDGEAIAGLHLYPPDRRGMTSVQGLLLCRLFHYPSGRRRRRYWLSVSPGEKSIFVAGRRLPHGR